MTEGDFNPQQTVAIDTETTGLIHWKNDRAFSVGMCDENGNTWYCEWPVDPFTRMPEPDPMDLEFIQKFAGDPWIAKVFHNAKFDCRMLEAYGIKFEGKIDDTHIAARICNNVEFNYQLKRLAKQYLGIPNDDEKDLQEAVRRARRQAQQYNREAAKSGKPLILLGEEMEMDYWLPRYYEVDNEMCEKYCRMDVVRTMGLFLMYEEIMTEDRLLKDAYFTEMYKLWPILYKMEGRGVRIDSERVRSEIVKAKKNASEHMEQMVKAIKEQSLRPSDLETFSPEDFNPNSVKQLRRVLYLPKGEGGLGLYTKKTSGTGELSTDKNAIRELMGESFVRDVVAYKSSRQVISLFFEKYLDLMTPCHISEGEKSLHPGFNQVGAATFRFSCSNPNLQQVGNPKTAHNVITTYHPRAPFGPRKGYNWYAADYAQQELRLFASISKNKFLLGEILSGNDPNSAVANKAWGGKNNPQALKAAAIALDLGKERPTNDEVAVVWEAIGWNSQAAREFGDRSTRSHMVAEEWLAEFNYDIVKAEKSVGRSNSRGRAKCVMFAKIYGGGPSSVTELLYCDLEEARTFMKDFDEAMPDLNVYMSSMIRQAKRDGFIINPYGRKVRVEEGFEYKAVNYMIQSTAACQMKESIIRCDELFRKSGLDAHVIMTIHDELLFEIKKTDSKKWLLRGICEIMSDNQDRISVPTPVEIKRAAVSWDDKEAVEL